MAFGRMESFPYPQTTKKPTHSAYLAVLVLTRSNAGIPLLLDLLGVYGKLGWRSLEEPERRPA